MQTFAMLRTEAMNAGLRPVAVEIGPGTELPPLPLMGGEPVSVLGLRLKWRAEPGLAVLAMPHRKIGRYECVAPMRFEAA